MEYDFGGYATKAGLRCSDGRTIMPDAFKHQDGQKVPLVWKHNHNDPSYVLGHAVLENRGDGVYVYCKFNDTDSAKTARMLVKHEDITSLSIYANQLVEKTRNVIHGMIREVSLVVAGANPGALIDNIVLQHEDGSETILDEARIFFDQPLEHVDAMDWPRYNNEGEAVSDEVQHAETDGNEDKTLADIYESMNEEQQNFVQLLLGQVMEQSDDSEAVSESEEDPGETEVEHSADEAAVENEDKDDSENTGVVQHNQEGEIVTNVFENEDTKNQGTTLSHADRASIMETAKRTGSMKKAINDYALAHGIEDIDILFPDARAITTTPDFIKRRTEWVDAVMSGTNHTPFSRIKNLLADITVEEARARGYIKGNFKEEEWFGIAGRTTTPQTVYKKQKLDRDDIIDIVDFDVVTWLKGEMRIMLEEEIARAILIGDGRSNASNDKIKEDHIRPIASDSEVYQTTLYVNIDDANSSAEEVIDALTLNRRHYRGSGNPVFFTSETMLARLLLIKDGMQRRVYQSTDDLKVALRVSNILTVELLEGSDIVGIMVNLSDYTVGADRGGNVTMFDDFDIDYNAEKYLIETRISGALTKYKAAIVVRKVPAAAALVVPVAPAFANNEVTVATTTGVTYKNKTTGTTLTTASPVELTEGQTLTVVAVPASASYYFSSSNDDEWTFEYQA